LARPLSRLQFVTIIRGAVQVEGEEPLVVVVVAVAISQQHNGKLSWMAAPDDMSCFVSNLYKHAACVNVRTRRKSAKLLLQMTTIVINLHLLYSCCLP
jgi:hypothetical protein